jgi:plastocyanin domain-containing protein
MTTKKPLALAAALLALPALALAQHDHGAAPAKAGAAPAKAGSAPASVPAGFIEVSVTGDGFVPDKLQAKKGQKMKLLITRKTDRTCATEIVIPDAGVNQALPLNQTVLVEFTPQKAGTLKFACAMGHIGGVLVVD